MWRRWWWRIIEPDPDVTAGKFEHHATANFGRAEPYSCINANAGRSDTVAGTISNLRGSNADAPGRVGANDHNVCGRRGRHAKHVDAQ
jgi:hypothetical protein